jgi:zinc protease
MNAKALVKGFSLVVIALAVGCSSSPKKAENSSSNGGKGTSAATSKSSPNAAQAPTPGFKLRPMHEVRLENGLKIIFIVDNSLPRVSLSLLTRVGSRQDPKGKEGLNFITAHLLEDGTQSKDAMALAGALAELGTEVGIEPGNDLTVMSMDGLVNSSDKLLALFTDIAMNPAFLDQEVARAKSQTIAQQQKKIDDPSAYANDAFDAFLFAGHPYAVDITGTQSSVRKIRKQDIIRHYLSYYRPNNSEIAVVGRFNKEFESKVAENFKKWTKKPVKPFQAPELAPIKGLEMRLVSKPGLEQTQIRFGEFGIRRNDPDFLKLRLANVALGGEFGSRLNQKVRDDLGLTYSINSYFDAKADRGPFAISTFTRNDSVGKTIAETLKVFSEFAEKGMTEPELAAAKEQLLGQFPRAIETADHLAFNVLLLDFYGIPLSYLQDFHKNVEAITLQEVNDAVHAHLDAKDLRILVYGDKAKILSQLKEYHPEVVRAK